MAARESHKLKVTGSNPVSATNRLQDSSVVERRPYQPVRSGSIPDLATKRRYLLVCTLSASAASFCASTEWVIYGLQTIGSYPKAVPCMTF